MPDQETPQSEDRKPQPQTKEPAQVVLNRFLKEQGIALGIRNGELETTNSGAMIIHPPQVVAMYASDAAPKTKPN